MEGETSTAENRDGGDSRRCELERAAYGRTETRADEERAAEAARELALWRSQENGPGLVAEDEAAFGRAPTVAPGGSVTVDHPVDPPETDTTVGRLGGRHRIHLLVAAGLVAALGIGFAAGTAIGHATPSANGRPTPTPTLTATFDPSALALSALSVPAKDTPTPGWFSTQQSKADRYPYLANTPQVIAATTRLVASSPSDGRVWIGHSSSPAGGYCLMASSNGTGKEPAEEAASCVTAAQFASRGLSLSDDHVAVKWTSAYLGVSPGKLG
jgi:hypothetical protein